MHCILAPLAYTDSLGPLGRRMSGLLQVPLPNHASVDRQSYVPLRRVLMISELIDSVHPP